MPAAGPQKFSGRANLFAPSTQIVSSLGGCQLTFLRGQGLSCAPGDRDPRTRTMTARGRANVSKATMLSGKDHSDSLKSLPEILEEELNGEIGSNSSAEISYTQQQARLKDVYRRIHSLETKRSALCLSGGGIRSASFGLGVLQALARAGLLDKFDYLSTVSGGGYIGGWLSAWIHHHPRGREGVVAELKTTQDQLIEPESDPIRHLRAFSNYLTPRFGLFSADSWSIGATILRDILLNWIVLLSWLAAILLIPRFCVFGAFVRPAPTTSSPCSWGRSLAWRLPPLTQPLTFRSFGDSRMAATPFSPWLVRPNGCGGLFLLRLVGGLSQHQRAGWTFHLIPVGLVFDTDRGRACFGSGCLAARAWWHIAIGARAVPAQIRETPEYSRRPACNDTAHRSFDGLFRVVDRGEDFPGSGQRCAKLHLLRASPFARAVLFGQRFLQRPHELVHQR